MKSLKKHGFILALITLVVLILVLKDDFDDVINLLKTANIGFILIALLLHFTFMTLESLAFNQILKSYDEKFKFKNTFSITIITKFFNGITPFSTGGQPMQVYMLKQHGFRITKATNAIMQNFILYQVALVVFGIISITLNYVLGVFPKVELLGYLVILGFSINTIIMIMLFVISFSNKFNKFIIEKSINILSKFKIIRNKEEQRIKWEERCNDFHEGADYILSHKKLCFKGFLYYILALLIEYSIPFFTALALGANNIELLPFIVASSYVTIVGSFVPIPGASGGIEYAFIEFFKNFIVGGLLSATLLIWRTITYYIPMIAGAILFNLRKEN